MRTKEFLCLINEFLNNYLLIMQIILGAVWLGDFKQGYFFPV
jgi:hypothetical protein